MTAALAAWHGGGGDGLAALLVHALAWGVGSEVGRQLVRLLGLPTFVVPVGLFLAWQGWRWFQRSRRVGRRGA